MDLRAGLNSTEVLFTLPFRERLDLTLLKKTLDGNALFKGETVLAKRFQPIGRDSVLVYEKPVKIQFIGRIETYGSVQVIVLSLVNSLEFVNEQNKDDASAAKDFLNQALFPQ